MEAASGSRLKKFFLRLAFYAGGLIIIAIILLALAFSLLKPKLLSLARNELRKQGLQARELDMSLFGKLHIYDLSAPLKQGGRLGIDEASVRPPLHFWGRTWLGGAGSLYNLRLEKGAMQVFIPQLNFSGAALEDKDPAIASRSLQMLKRLRAGNIYADKVDISLKKPAAGAAANDGGSGAEIKAELHGFGLQGLSEGKIGKIFYRSMGSGAAAGLTAAEPAAGAEGAAGEGGKGSGNAAGRRSDMQSGAFSAVNIDAASLYALARSLAPQSAGSEAGYEAVFPAQARALIGAIRVSNVDIEAEDDNLGRLHIAAGELASGGLVLKGDKSAADFITAVPADKAAAADKDQAEKQIMLHNLRGLLADMAAVDVSAANINIAAEPGPKLLAARAAAEAKAAKAAADKALANAKTVNDVLNQTQQQDEQSAAGNAAADNDNGPAEDETQADADSAPRGGLGQELKTLPLQFKLSLKSFALRADQWQQAIPHQFYVKLQDLIYRPGPNNNALLQALQGMGREDLQFSLLGDIAWNPANAELAVNRLAFYGRNMGGFSVQGRFLNVPQSIFDGRPEAVNAALNQTGIANMEIWLEDSGFIKNLVQWGTTQINISAKELQDDLHDIAVKSPPLLFRNRQEAQNLAKVFGDFVNNSGNVRIMMSAPQPGGLKLSDIMNSQEDLSVVLDKLHLTADRPAGSAPMPD